MPLEEKHDNNVRTFILCAGIDPDTDMVPHWCQEYKLNNVIPSLNVKAIYSVHTQGTGKGVRNVVRFKTVVKKNVNKQPLYIHCTLAGAARKNC